MPALIVALMTPFSPTISVSVDEISPRNFPFSITVPLNVYFPSISDPSSMNAVRSPVLTARLARFFHSMRHSDVPAHGDLLVEHVDGAARRLGLFDLDDVAV